MKYVSNVRAFCARTNVRAFCARTGASIVAVLLVPSIAFAQATPTFDPADTLAMVADAKSFITTVGLAVLGLIMLAKGIKWVRKAG